MKNTDKNVSEIKLYTLEELTDMLNVTVYTLRNYVKSGKLKAAKIGGKWRVSEENLKKFVNGD
ncbi:MAG: helix-turn-helix domain-containing protein [Clostridia bacterium]|nr:helix-turn-helix domain-containing protein [Clostridia bacterium]